MEPPHGTAPAWSCQLLDALARLESRSATVAERSLAWRLLHASLFAALRGQARRIAPMSQEDLEDVASAKALELLRQAEGGQWRARGRSAHELAGFVRRVARNGLVDLARRRGREGPPPEDETGWDALQTETGDLTEDPAELAAAEEFVSALVECVGSLSARSRNIWFRSAVLGRPSRETAGALGLRVGNVDVIAQRARRSLVDCMDRKGHRTADVAPRAFALLWSRAKTSCWLDADASGARDDD